MKIFPKINILFLFILSALSFTLISSSCKHRYETKYGPPHGYQSQSNFDTNNSSRNDDGALPIAKYVPPPTQKDR